MKTQVDKLLHALRGRPYTYMELIKLGISVCPWRRLSDDEVSGHLLKGERIVRKVNAKGLTTLRVVRG